MDTQPTTSNIIEKIENYFDKEIGFKDFALQIRRSNHVISTVMMQPNAVDNIPNSDWVQDFFYHLNSFAELIDPVLEKE